MAKKGSKSKKGTNSRPVEVTYKPTMSMSGKNFSGLKVGKKTKVAVTGRVIEESIETYGDIGRKKGEKSYRLEIDSVKPLKRGGK